MHARRVAIVTLFVAAAAIAVAAAADEHPRFSLSPWEWFPSGRRSNKSMLDYFFPSSRNAKQSPVYKDRDNATATATPSTTTTLETKPPSPSTSTKAKSVQTSRVTTTNTTPKPKQTSKTAKLTSPQSTPTLPPKHYTIYPSSILTKMETAPSTIVEKSQTFSAPSSSSSSRHTTLVGVPNYVDSTTAKTTLSEMVQAAQSDKASKSTHVEEVDSTTALAPDYNSTDDLDSREGSYPLRDRERPQTHQVKINEQTKKETVPLPAGSTSVLAKPTKYHYYPHNQHIYLLPECAIQQVCNAVYVRLNYTQPLCACPSRYRDPCSASLNADDLHTTRLTTDSKKKFASKAVTLVKTCEATSEMRECRAPRDWSLLALQNIRTGKSHYLVICRCPENHILEGPMSHDQPTYASVPGIRVFGMMCVRPIGATAFSSSTLTKFTSTIQSTTSSYKVDYSQPHYNPDLPSYSRFPSHSFTASNSYYNRMSRKARTLHKEAPPFPWRRFHEFAANVDWEN